MEIKQYSVSRDKLLHLLDRLSLDPPLLTLYIKPGTRVDEIEKTLLHAFDRGILVDEMKRRIITSPVGTAVFYGGGKAWLVTPPFPLEETVVARAFEPGPLRALLEKQRTVGLVLVRLGYFAAAVFRGEELLCYKAGTGLVHARHHKGGSSANRFARHRDKQIEYFFTRVEGHCREVLEGRLRELDCVFYGGTAETIQTLRRQCRFFTRLDGLVSPRLLNVREPKFSALPLALGLAFASGVFEIKE